MRILLLALLALTLGSCQERESEEAYRETIQTLMNERHYLEAIHSLEARVAAPDRKREPETMQLLAQAHLGAAGFELVGFADRVLDVQKARSQPVSRLFPGCVLERINEPPGPEEPGFKCLFKRLLLQLPDANDPHMMRARMLFRAAYPYPESAPEHVNFLVAAVELASAFSRAGAVLNFFLDPPPEAGSYPAIEYPARLRVVATELKTFLTEVQFGLSRARRAHKRVTRFLFGFESSEIFRESEELLEFAAETGVPALMRFADKADELLSDPESVEMLRQLTDFARAFAG